MLRTTIAMIIAIVVGSSLIAGFGAPDAASAAQNSSSAASAASLTAISPVSGDPQQLAKVIVAAQKAGNFSTDPTTIYDREIAPVATGQVIDGCGVSRW